MLEFSNFPDPKFVSMKSQIISEQPWVINTLIDNSSIERMILIEDAKEARHVMFDDHRPPKGGKKCSTFCNYFSEGMLYW
jgi:hypothetical protein